MVYLNYIAMARLNKNNAEYFTHDADMRNDVRVKALFRRYKHTGYAVWCFLLEALTDSDFFEIEWTGINRELYSADFDVTPEELSEIVDYCIKIELLTLQDGKLFSVNHKARLEAVAAYRDKQRENGKKGGNPNFKKGQQNPYYPPEKDNQDITKDNPKITGGYEKDNQDITKDNHRREEKRRVNKYSLSIRGETKILPENLFNSLEALLQEQEYLEALCMNNAVPDIEQMKDYLKAFFVELGNRGESYKDEKDAKHHFANWLKIELQNERKTKKGGKNANNRDSTTTTAELGRSVAEGYARALYEKQQRGEK
jgi:hypothetical protein